MTGIERLRKLAKKHRIIERNITAATIDNIADQIEREHVSRIRVMAVLSEMERHVSGVEGADGSPVARWASELREALGGEECDPADLLPAEDAEAVAWVREHGGLDHVRAEWRSRVPYDRYERRRQRLLGHIAECEAALRRRNERIEELGHRVSDLTAENAELRKRAMPEGMEWLVEAWPRYEDDAPLKLGDTALIDGEADMVEAIQLWIHGKPVIYGDGGSQQLDKGERVKRPAPKVLDADGVEVEVGDDLYSVEGMLKFHVSAIDKKSGRIATEAMFALDKWADPKMYTHHPPVLAADGRPLREGETVWFTTSGREMRVDKIEHRPEGFWALELFADGSKRHSAPVSILAHERPVADTWERLEKDAANLDEMPCDYSAKDLVRRAKALAERDS